MILQRNTGTVRNTAKKNERRVKKWKRTSRKEVAKDTETTEHWKRMDNRSRETLIKGIMAGVHRERKRGRPRETREQL